MHWGDASERTGGPSTPDRLGPGLFGSSMNRFKSSQLHAYISLIRAASLTCARGKGQTACAAGAAAGPLFTTVSFSVQSCWFLHLLYCAVLPYTASVLLLGYFILPPMLFFLPVIHLKLSRFYI